MNTILCGKLFPTGLLITKMLKGTLFLLTIILISRICFASAESVVIIPDPRTVAMGDGAVSQKSSLPSSSFSNPAALVGINRAYITFNQLSLPFDARYNMASFALPAIHGNLGVSVLSLDYGNFVGLDNSFSPTDVGATGDTGLVLSYALPIFSEVPVRKDYGAVGLNVKFLHSALSGYSSEAIAMDLGGIYNIPILNGLTAGMVYKNFGSSMKFVREDASLHSSFDFGVGYNNENFYDISLTLDFSMPKDEPNSFSVGAAISPVYFMNLRVGWRKTNDSLITGARFGFGLNFGSFNFDYAFVPFDNFGNINMMSVGMALDSIISEEKASDYYLNKHFREAAAYYDRGDYIEARREFENILSAYPDHAPSHKYLEKIINALETKDQQKVKQINKWLKKAESVLSKKNYIEASEYYNRVIYTDPYNSVAKQGVDNIRKIVSDVKQEEVVRINLSLIENTWKKASQLYRKGDLVKSKQEFNNVLKVDPENQEAKKRILEIDEQLSRIAAGKVNEFYTRGLDLYHSGKYEEAIKYFEAVVIASPNRLDAQDMIKRSQQNLSDLDAKVRAEKLAVEQEGMKGEMARIFDEALKAYEKGDLEDSLSKFQRSEQLAISYEFTDYIQDTRNYITVVNQALTDKHYKLGTELLRNNRLEAAVSEYRKALDYNPENTLAKTDLERIGKELAQKYYEQGMAYFARSDMNKAKDMFKRSLSYEPDKLESKRALERID
ncbi:MAG: tetratricopeptide repeat protein [Elusimicrobia bacterium]|nr:tetratricopeptide repeat protein [Elusimicrobiota bacterium]